jgi:hypothetical protein
MTAGRANETTDRRAPPALPLGPAARRFARILSPAGR